MSTDRTKRKGNTGVDGEISAHPAKKIKVIPLEGTTNTDTTSDPPSDPSSTVDTLSLHDLLDFSSLEDESAISSRFDVIARVLMHEYQLVVSHDGKETAFEIQEMEFYLRKAGHHEDPFTHGSEEQKVSGRWYFHRSPRRSNDASRSSTSLTSYRGGTRKGLDLTIGNPLPHAVSPHFSQPGKSSALSDTAGQKNQAKSSEHLRGGILLRSLRSLGKNGTIDANPKPNSVYGPSLLVDKILSLSGASSIPELVETMWGGDTSALNPPNPSLSSRTSFLYLKRATSSARVLPQIHKSPRIGLDLSHPGTSVPSAQSTTKDLHPRVRFLPKLYRYYTRPVELVKGRPQTLYGFIHIKLNSRSDSAYRSLSGDLAFRASLTKGTGLKDAPVKKYLAEYDAGRKDGLKHLKLCIGPSGKGAADSPTTYLKMMGALDTVVQLSSTSRNAGSSSLENT
ncbi:hypothetical protein D9756_000126 [Leucocoprinus leucothites]|uniref:Uncharacterized protein n=1 Tax=Leucocoprinus leucothites TaxID=201217 RepID=A0A8H5GFJ8_9AGAR|nr:hypothetical protein D9756_000126 [Leucoagaricus leucothites]